MASSGDGDTLVVDGLDITELGDDELYERLTQLNASVGPIVESTRKVYQRRLFVLLGGYLPDCSFTQGDQGGGSESEGESEVQKSVVRETTTTTTFTNYTSRPPPPLHQEELRHRTITSYSGSDESAVSGGVVFNPDLHTPSPRRSLRTVSSSPLSASSSISTTQLHHRLINNGSSIGGFGSGGIKTAGKDVVDEGAQPGKVAICFRLTFKLIILALILVLAIYFYQNTPAESPFKAVEQLAREVMEGQAAGAGKAAPPPPADPQEQKVFA